MIITRCRRDGFTVAALLAALVLLIAAVALSLVPQPAQAASLVRVTNFGTNPTGLNMYVYVPGRYPRMQLWHGTTDTTLAYPNHGEELDQWTNLHGLSRTPGSTDRPQPSWTRTRYGTTGTAATIEGISIQGTGHSLPMPGMLAYSIAFLGLDGPPATTTTPVPVASCKIAASVGAWNTGLTETITITNTSTTAVSGWQLRFTLPGGQRITGGWRASHSPATGEVSVRNADHNAGIAPNSSVQIGFQAAHTGDSAAAGGFTLNGEQCAVG